MARGEAWPSGTRGLRIILAAAILGSLGLFGLAVGLALAAAGDLDPTLRDTGLGPGKAFAEFLGYDEASAVAVQPDGRIVVAGTARTAPNEPGAFALVRFISDGTLDPSFGSGGKVTTQIGGIAEAHAVAIQADGKIVVAGYSNPNITLYPEDFAVARYNPDGSLDPEFGGGGAVLTDFGTEHDQANAVAIQPDGKIVVAGTANGEFALARYEPDGQLDYYFGYGGQLIFQDFTVSAAFDRGVTALALQPDGKIVVVGVTWTSPVHSFAVARFTPGGAPDPDFGSGGKVSTSFGGPRADLAAAVAVQGDGKIVVGGTMAGSATATSYHFFELARYNPDGSLDTSFSSDGKVTTAVAAAGTQQDCSVWRSECGDDLYALVLQPDGKIVAAGVGYTPTGAAQFAVVRYNSNGSFDTSFSGDGKLTTNFGGEEAARALAIQPDAKIVAAGPAELNSGSRFFVLARYLAQ